MSQVKIPPFIPSEPHRKAAEKVVNDLKKREDLLGVIIFGSVVEKTPKPTSDLDLLVIVSSFDWGIKCFKIDGITVELFIRSILKVFNDIFYGENELIVRNIGAGKIYYTKENSIIFPLKKFAEDRYRKGPPPCDETYIFLMRLMYTNAIDEVKRKCKDSTETLYLLNWILSKAIVDYYRLQCVWLPKWSYLILDLKERDKFLYERCRHFLTEIDLERKYQSVKEIVEYVLKPFGGYTPEEWKMIWSDGKATISEQ